MNRKELIECIIKELNRQNQKDYYDAPYLYAERNDDKKVSTGIDGELNIGELADAIIYYNDEWVSRLLEKLDQ